MNNFIKSNFFQGKIAIAISNNKRKSVPINNDIKAKMVMLIDENGNKLGHKTKEEALKARQN